MDIVAGICFASAFFVGVGGTVGYICYKDNKLPDNDYSLLDDQPKKRFVWV
jgi:hypothetical protein